MDAIHYPNKPQQSIRRDYHCEKLLDYYILKYSCKYSSEIQYALDQIDLQCYPHFQIVSLGCGGVPDLMAIEEKSGNKPISYYGFDCEIFWRKIHDRVVNYFSGKYNIHFDRETELAQALCSCNESFLELPSANVIVMGYLLSNLKRSTPDETIDCLCSGIAELLFSRKKENSPSLFIFNDVFYDDKGRFWFSKLQNSLRSYISLGKDNGNPFVKTDKCFHFEKSFRLTSDLVKAPIQLHNTSSNLYSNLIDDLSPCFGCAIKCTSFQWIYELK
ncbi:MAG: hypothetical protein Q4C95_13025 [Planctomycetia bacterium]|nr:hypothetical protein [Planctomycetia bacterium]